eukprot:TRINITY_DN3195_c0_g1_i1.p1 TRINITY_DN3195_c0_g1~~TRINITY_DN3195_c0_g1_i1.p1  ORF type:complete len:130 (-),score=8.14 TRINITY_DN3195_c0_g1_i1:588-977(-)
MFWLVISECASVDPALYKETSVTSSPVLWPKPCMLRAKQESVQTSTCTLTVSKRVEFCDFGFDWGKVVLHGDLFVLHRPVMDYRYSVLLSVFAISGWIYDHSTRLPQMETQPYCYNGTQVSIASLQDFS